MRRIKLSRKASQRIEHGHVWVYKSEIVPELAPDVCETALLVDERGRLLGSAMIDSASSIPVRLYSRREQPLDQEWLRSRLEHAFEWRRTLIRDGSTGYRMVFSESDWLPGLIIDRFGSNTAIQIGMRNYLPLLPNLLGALQSELTADTGLKCVVVEQGSNRSLLLGEMDDSKSLYRLNSLQFEADLMDGPKTGAFLDQRENYLAVAGWAKRLGISGRALDLFTSSGGFALHLAQVMSQVDAVDSSEAAITRVKENAERNQIGNVRGIEADVKQFLRGLSQAKRRYECVVADPPAFAKQVRQKEEATRAYYDLNLRALNAVAPSGLFVSCSCSRAIHEENLVGIIRDAAQESRKTLTLLERRGQPADHRPVLHVPESNYLKCLIFNVSSSN